MAIRDDFTPGEVLAAADLNDTFGSKANSASPSITSPIFTGNINAAGATFITNSASIAPLKVQAVSASASNIIEARDASASVVVHALRNDGQATFTNGTQSVTISGQDGAIELIKNNGEPYIDFKSSVADDYDVRLQMNSNGLQFWTGGNGATSVAAFVDSSKRMFVGQQTVPTNADTAAGTLHIAQTVSFIGFQSRSGTVGAFSGNKMNIFWTASNAQLWVDNVNIGTISTTSDYRLKHQVEDAPEAWDRVKDLRPITFRWRDEGIFEDDGVTHEGFIAHELAEVIPSAVNYDKDSVDENGNPTYQSLNLPEILPVLVKALQESQARVEALEARVAALEA